MAKKLNTTVAVIVIALVILGIGGIAGLLVYRHIHRDPERALVKAREALDAGDYRRAESLFGRAYIFGKTDAFQLERLFELADFHLIHNDQHEADWSKALGCWKQVITNDPGNLEARRKLLDFYFTAADAGDPRLWKDVRENTTEIMKVMKNKGIEPDKTLLKTHARALLSIAERGETTNRREVLQESTDVLNRLVEAEPRDEELYLLLAQASVLDGRLGQLSGMIKAEERGREKAEEWLKTGIEKADNKAAAVANMFLHKRQTLAGDPNQLITMRTDIEQYSRQIEPNAKFWQVISLFYEIPAAAPQAELNRAIEAIRQARQLEPQNVEYAIQMVRYLYRKGMAYNDPASVDDAIQLATDALAFPNAQNIPGPLAGRNRNYRYVLNTFLADAYLRKAMVDPSDETWVARAEPLITEINSFVGSMENPVAEKYQGLLAFAKGERQKGIRLLYKNYERVKALDKPGEFSNVDPLVCVVLANAMKEENQLGPQREFLETAMRSNSPFMLQNPDLVLDYAEILAKLGGWAAASQVAGDYQNRYGASERSVRLLIEAAIGQGKFETAVELLESANLPKPLELKLELQMALQQASALQREVASDLSKDKPELTAEQAEQLNQYRQQRNDKLNQLLQQSPEAVDPQTLSAICGDLIRNGQAAQAAAFIDLYLPSHPDVLSLKVLRAQAATPDPLNLSQEAFAALQENVYQQIANAQTKAVALSQFYRGQKHYDKAQQALNQLSGQAAEDAAVLLERFDLAIETEDIAAAEGLLRPLRLKNADGFEGTLLNARLEILKKNYPLAIRRLDECISLQPLGSTPYFLKSQIYQQQENYQAACENAQKAAQMNPLNPLYAKHVASVLFARNSALGSKVTIEQRNEAERAIAAAMFLNPSEWQLQSVYAESIQLQAPDRAFLIRQRLLESYPNASNAVMLGNMALRMAQSEWDTAKKSGLIEQAGKAYAKAIALDPDFQPAVEAYADYQQMTGNPEEAMKIISNDENMLWKFYLRNGQFDKAAELLVRMHEANPNDAMLLRGLIMTAEGMGDRAGLKGYLDQLAAVDKSKETELLILQKYLDYGYSAEAEQRLTGFKERHPEEKAALLIEAWTKMTRGELNEAMSLTNRYLESDTNHGGAWRLRGRLFRLMNQPRKAIDDLQRSKTLADTPAIRMELASVFLEARQSAAAIGELATGLQDAQAPVQMRLMLETIYQQSNLSGDLEKLYAETLAKYPQSVFWHSRAGQYLMKRGNLTAARTLLQKAWDLSVEQGVGDPGVLSNILDCLYQNKQYDEAFSLASGQIDTALAPVAYAYMGQILVQKDQKARATEHFFTSLDKVGTNEMLQDVTLTRMLDSVGEQPVHQWISKQLEANPSSISAHLVASRLAEKKELFNKAIEPIDQCLKIAGKDNPAWIAFALKKANLLVQAYSKTADRAYLSQSIELFRSILEQQPENPSLLNNMAYLLADNDQDLEVALEYARKAHQRDPGNAVYLDTYALAQCKTGDYETAEQNLLRAIQLYQVTQQDVPWDIYKHLGMAREGMGKAQQAVEAYRQALESATGAPDPEKQKLQQTIDKLQQS
jgi:tetratricopeptide (TPR) repeat protein